MWIQRLPQRIKTIASCSADVLPNLAIMADKIFDTTEDSSIQELSSPSKSNSDLVNIIYLHEDKINALNKKMDISGPRNRAKSPNPDL